MREDTIREIIKTLASEYSRKWSKNEREFKIITWNVVLHDLTDEQGMNGLRTALLSSREFMPSVGQFREMCLTPAGCASLEEQAMEAWGLVERAMNPYDSPVFADAAIAETIRNMGGWVKLCNTAIDDLPFRRKDFLETYPIYKRRGGDYSPMLAGIYGPVDGGGNDNRKLIGFDSDADRDAVLLALDERERNESNILSLINYKK
jgi:hypothetical protein